MPKTLINRRRTIYIAAGAIITAGFTLSQIMDFSGLIHQLTPQLPLHWATFIVSQFISGSIIGMAAGAIITAGFVLWQVIDSAIIPQLTLHWTIFMQAIL